MSEQLTTKIYMRSKLTDDLFVFVCVCVCVLVKRQSISSLEKHHFLLLPFLILTPY